MEGIEAAVDPRTSNGRIIRAPPANKKACTPDSSCATDTAVTSPCTAAIAQTSGVPLQPDHTQPGSLEALANPEASEVQPGEQNAAAGNVPTSVVTSPQQPGFRVKLRGLHRSTTVLHLWQQLPKPFLAVSMDSTPATACKSGSAVYSSLAAAQAAAAQVGILSASMVCLSHIGAFSFKPKLVHQE